MQWCKSLLSIEGDNLQFYPNFALFSSLVGGMNFDQDFFQMSKLSEDQKKGLHQKWNTFFSNSGEDQKKKVFSRNGIHFFLVLTSACAQMHTRVKLLEGMQTGRYHTQIVRSDLAHGTCMVK